MIKVILCDDHALIRRGIRDTLSDAPDIEVVGEAGDYGELRALMRNHTADVLVLDINLPGRSGLDVLRELRKASDFAETPVIVISAWSHSDDAAVQAGADRFVAKPFDPDELRDAAVALLEDDSANE